MKCNFVKKEQNFSKNKKASLKEDEAKWRNVALLADSEYEDSKRDGFTAWDFPALRNLYEYLMSHHPEFPELVALRDPDVAELVGILLDDWDLHFRNYTNEDAAAAELAKLTKECATELGKVITESKADQSKTSLNEAVKKTSLNALIAEIMKSEPPKPIKRPGDAVKWFKDLAKDNKFVIEQVETLIKGKKLDQAIDFLESIKYMSNISESEATKLVKKYGKGDAKKYPLANEQ